MSRSPQQTTRGFTIIEMIVTLTIISLISGALLMNYNSVNSKISLENTANELALWVREAQAYAMGVKTQDVTLYWSYGIYFELASPKSFILYVDKFDSSYNTTNPDKRYNARLLPCGDAGSECVKQVALPNGISIDQLYGWSATPGAIPGVSVNYTRPKPDARITDNVPNLPYSQVDIRLRSAKGYTYCVQAAQSGQIGVAIC